MGPPPQHPDLSALLAHASWARDLARSLVSDGAVAEDLVQEAWVAALERPPSHSENLRGWLGAVIRNLARAHGRGRDRRVSREARVAAERAEDSLDAGDLASQLDTQRRLAEAVLGLEEPYRATVILRFYQGLNASQIAERTGKSPGTIRWRIKVALDQLRERLDDDFDGDRSAWIALVLPIANKNTTAAAGAAVSISTLKGLAAMKIATKHTIAAVALLATLTAVMFSAGIFGEPAERVDNTPAPVTFTPIQDAATVATTDEESERAEVITERDTPAIDAGGLEAGAHVSMRIVDAEGRPIPDAVVTSYRGQRTRTASGPDGLVRLPMPGLEERTGVYFAVDHPDYVIARLQYVVEPDRLTEFGDITLAHAGAVEGRVLLADGSPAPLAWIEVGRDAFSRDLDDASYRRLRQRESEGDHHDPIADELGRFRLEQVPAGVVRLWAGLEGHLSSISAPVEVRAGMLSQGLEIRLGTLNPDDFLTGEVRLPDGSPAPFAHVVMQYTRPRFGGNGSGSFTADANGRFRKAAEPGNVYSLRALDRDGLYPAASADGLRGGDNVVLQQEEGRFLDLHVTHDGEPFTTAEVWASDPNSGMYASNPTQVVVIDNYYRVPTPDSDFMLTVRADGFDLVELGPISGTSTPAILTAQLIKLPGLRGQVTADGQPVAGARLIANKLALQGVVSDDFPSLVQPFEDERGVADEEGRFELTVREAGRWVLRAEAAGYAPSEFGPFDYHPRVGLDGIELDLTPGGALEGLVLEGGRPAAGRIVAVSRGDGHPTSTRSGADGRYRFDHLMPGRWQVELRTEEILPGSGVATTGGEPHTPESLPANCIVREGETAVMDLGAGPSPTLKGRLTFDGEGPGAWSASLQLADSLILSDDNTARIGPDGAFSIQVSKPGLYQASFASDALDFGFLTELELTSDLHFWSMDLRTGAIVINGVPDADSSVPFDPNGEMQILVGKVDGLTAFAPLSPKPGGVLTLDRIPAGHYEIRSGPAHALDQDLEKFGTAILAVEVVAGEREEVAIPIKGW